jgi:hypothetical protein
VFQFLVLKKNLLSSFTMSSIRDESNLGKLKEVIETSSPQWGSAKNMNKVFKKAGGHKLESTSKRHLDAFFTNILGLHNIPPATVDILLNKNMFVYGVITEGIPVPNRYRAEIKDWFLREHSSGEYGQVILHWERMCEQDHHFYKNQLAVDTNKLKASAPNFTITLDKDYERDSRVVFPKFKLNANDGTQKKGHDRDTEWWLDPQRKYFLRDWVFKCIDEEEGIWRAADGTMIQEYGINDIRFIKDNTSGGDETNGDDASSQNSGVSHSTAKNGKRYQAAGKLYSDESEASENDDVDETIDWSSLRKKVGTETSLGRFGMGIDAMAASAKQGRTLLPIDNCDINVRLLKFNTAYKDFVNNVVQLLEQYVRDIDPSSVQVHQQNLLTGIKFFKTRIKEGTFTRTTLEETLDSVPLVNVFWEALSDTIEQGDGIEYNDAASNFHNWSPSGSLQQFAGECNHFTEAYDQMIKTDCEKGEWGAHKLITYFLSACAKCASEDLKKIVDKVKKEYDDSYKKDSHAACFKSHAEAIKSVQQKVLMELNTGKRYRKNKTKHNDEDSDNDIAGAAYQPMPTKRQKQQLKQKSDKPAKMDKSHVQCYTCQGFGHYASECNNSKNGDGGGGDDDGREKKRSKNNGDVKFKGRCSICKQAGHKMTQCQQYKNKGAKNKAGSAAADKSGDGNGNSA